jgi:NHLM bacteriocin system ABC transporter peptidase/ATP-binding protein/NHLM bacteriocin system ABC transporter ATP-binding protein
MPDIASALHPWRSPWWRPRVRVRTPTVLQMDRSECGAAALAMILAYHGRFVPLDELRVACGVSRNGSNAYNLINAARTYGLEGRGYTTEPSHLHTLPLPAILFWDFAHFVVLEGFGSGLVYLNDPIRGPRTVTDREFDDAFTGVVLTFEKTDRFRAGGERRSVIRSLRTRLATHHADLAFIVICTLALVIPGVAIPAFTRIYVDHILIHGLHGWLRPLLLAMGLAILVKAALTWLQQRRIATLATRLSLAASAQFLWHTLSLPIAFISQRYPGDLAARLSANERVSARVSGELLTSLVGLAPMLVYAALMWRYDVVLTLLGILLAVVNLLVLRIVARKNVDVNRERQQMAGAALAISIQGLQGIETLKASGSESDFFKRWAGHQANVLNAEQGIGKTALYLQAVPPLLAAVDGALVLTVGGLRIIEGAMTMGMLLAFQVLMTSFFDPVTTLVNLEQKFQQTRVDLDRLDDVLRQPRDPQVRGAADADQAHPIAATLAGAVELRDVTFGYSRIDPPILAGFNLTVQPGQRLAIVGASGSGKSTVARLIAGLHEPWSGDVLFDGVARRALPRSAVTQALAFVDQDVALFQGTVRENLTLWNADVPDAALIEAAKDAEIHEDIVGREGGYDGLLDETGRNFSGGQRQRLEIARALAGNPRILVLDEATSALDPEIEARVADSLRRRGCTCIIIAHRLSTIRDCDEILVLDQGAIVQRGRHGDIAHVEGPYQRLIAASACGDVRLDAPATAADPDARQPFLRRDGKESISEKTPTLCHHEFTTIGAQEQRRPSDRSAHDSPLGRACHEIGTWLGFSVATHWRERSDTPAVTALAQESGIRYRTVRLRGQALAVGSEPLLVFRRRDQAPAALLPRRGRRGYWHYDPQTRRRRPLDATTATELNPLAFMFYRTFPRQVLSLREVLRFGLKGTQRAWLTIVASSVASGLLALVLPIATAVLFDSTIPHARRDELLIVGGMLIASALAIALFTVTRGMAVLQLQGRLSLTLDAALWDRLLNLPLQFFRQYTAGDLAQRGLAFSQMHAALTASTLNALLYGTFSLCSAAVLVYFSPPLASVAAVLALLAVLVTIVATTAWGRRQPKTTAIAGGLVGMVVEWVRGLSKLRAAGVEARVFDRWARAFTAKKQADFEARRITTWLATFDAVYFVACTAVIYAVNIWMQDTRGHALSIGTFIAFMTAFSQCIAGVLALSRTIVNAGSSVALYTRAAPILRTVPETARPSCSDASSDVELTGAIAVHHLSFRYRPDAPLVLRDVSFQIAPGQFVAIVGPSGCGKSTLLRLLLGFETPESGSIQYDGIDLATLDAHAVRRQIGVVLQSGGLLAGTIKDNICGMARLNLEDVWDAARLVGLDDVIRALPMGMQTAVLPDGTGLSGGQRQRLLIARAVARKSRLLMFDEATSALDNRTQALVSERIESLCATRLVIAHRLTTILEADCILVMDHGRIVQAGTYDRLMREVGLFRRLAQRQMV